MTEETPTLKEIEEVLVDGIESGDNVTADQLSGLLSGDHISDLLSDSDETDDLKDLASMIGSSILPSSSIFEFSLLERCRIMFENIDNVENIHKELKSLYNSKSENWKSTYMTKGRDIDWLKCSALAEVVLVFRYYRVFDEWEVITIRPDGRHSRSHYYPDFKECFYIIYNKHMNEEDRSNAELYENGQLKTRVCIMEGSKYYRDNKIEVKND